MRTLFIATILFSGLSCGRIPKVKEHFSFLRYIECIESIKTYSTDSIVLMPSYEDVTENLGFDLTYKPKSMEWTVKNAKLLLSSDKDLINYFKINKEKFEILRDELLVKVFLQSSKSLEELDASNTIQPQLDNLLIDNVGRAGFGSSKNLEFIIGGMIDNSVGYFYLKDKKNKPFMSPNGYIMIREIGNGWYLFKTT